MRLKIIAVLFFMVFLAGLAMAQDGGGKPLPGEGTATATTTPTALATSSSGDATPEAEASATPTTTPVAEEPTPVDADVEFPADMLEETDLDLEEAELVLYEPFDAEDAWELGEYEAGTMQIIEGQYIIESEGDGVLWGQNEDLHSDVVIQVITDQLSREENNGYGIMCRADPANNLNGYYLWISGDGFATIFKVENEGDDFVTLVEWEAISAINLGRDTNLITAVCVGEYLGLFVNGELAVETEDDTYATGVTGLSVYIFEEEENVEIAFDDVYIWQIGEFVAPDPEEEEDPTEEANNLDSDDAAEDVADALEQGDVQIELGDILDSDDFSDEGDWGILDEDGSLIEVGNGVYFFEEPNENLFTWSQDYDDESYEDVVIAIDAEQISEAEETGYGVMCRLEPDTDELNGYTFLVGADGTYIMGYWEGGDFETIEEGESDAINTGQESNTIYAVCVGDYFALYANGELVDEFEDDTFDEGVTGVGVISFIDETITVEFDNLYIWEAND